MIRNIVLKNLLINTVFKGLSFINWLIPKNENKILLYSNEGFRDNIKYLYEYLIENEYNSKYKIVCAGKKREIDDTNSSVTLVSLVGGVFHFLTSSHVYYCFGRIPITPCKGQIVIQMWHGTSFKGFDKSTRESNTIKNQFYTYVFASSEYFIPIVEKKFSVRKESVYLCGHPRTDWLFRDDIKYDLGTYDRIIIWLPTFRKSREMGYVDVNTTKIVPFYEKEELNELDEYLIKKDVYLIIKLHPLQDEIMVSGNYQNLLLLSDNEFRRRGYDLYRLLRQMDALITDYSSVFYDYLLLDRPIGFTEDDEKEYSINRGFSIENPNDFKPGYRIKSKQDLLAFITSVIIGRDEFKQKRKEINSLANTFMDGNCIRALKVSKIQLDGE